MDFDRYIFVDYENVQDINMDIIDTGVKMVIIVGETQNKVPVNLVKKTQPFGEAIEWIQIKSNGKKNALDFFIAYFLGYYISNQKNKEFIIYSKDTGYDPLIEYLKKENINVRRIVSFKQIVGINFRNGESNEIHEENIQKIKDNLSKVISNKRPKSKKGLAGHIKTLIKKSDDEIEKIIEEMFIQRIIFEENGHIKYEINE